MTGQLSFPDTSTLEAQKPAELLEAALTWIEQNPEAWRWIVGAAQRDAYEIGRVRVKSYIEHMRFRPLPWATEVVKLPNAFSAPFGRILAEWYPELRQYVPLNHSKLDGCAIPPRAR